MKKCKRSINSFGRSPSPWLLMGRLQWLSMQHFGADGSVILHAVILHHACCILGALGVLLCYADADLHDLCSHEQVRWHTRNCPRAERRMCGCRMSGRSGNPGIGASMPAVRKLCGLDQHLGCAAVDGCKTTIIFSTFAVCSKIQYAVTCSRFQIIENYKKL